MTEIRSQTIINTYNKNQHLKNQYVKVAKEFESLFLKEMLNTMFNSEYDSQEKSIYNSMLVEEYSKDLSKHLHLADIITTNLLKLHEA